MYKPIVARDVTRIIHIDTRNLKLYKNVGLFTYEFGTKDFNNVKKIKLMNMISWKEKDDDYLIFNINNITGIIDSTNTQFFDANDVCFFDPVKPNNMMNELKCNNISTCFDTLLPRLTQLDIQIKKSNGQLIDLTNKYVVLTLSITYVEGRV